MIFVCVFEIDLSFFLAEGWQVWHNDKFFSSISNFFDWSAEDKRRIGLCEWILNVILICNKSVTFLASLWFEFLVVFDGRPGLVLSQLGSVWLCCFYSRSGLRMASLGWVSCFAVVHCRVEAGPLFYRLLRQALIIGIGFSVWVQNDVIFYSAGDFLVVYI